MSAARVETPALDYQPNPLAQLGFLVNRVCLQCDHQILTTPGWDTGYQHVCDDGVVVYWPKA